MSQSESVENSKVLQKRHLKSVVPSEYHGLLLVDKPEGMTSHDVVARIRRVLGIKAVGHTGTLDPMASGLMVLLLGEATKISDYLLNGDKGYALAVQLGVRTDSLDRTGEVLSKETVDIPMEKIQSAIESLQGSHELLIPKFSAKKVDGKKLYEYARKSVEIDWPSKEMSFFDFKEIEIQADSFQLEMKCSKGSFIRSWSSQVGENLRVGATLTSLRRVYSHPYQIGEAIPLDDLEAAVHLMREEGQNVLPLKTCFPESFIPLVESLPTLKGLTVVGKNERLLRNGQVPSEIKKRLVPEQKEVNKRKAGVWMKAISGRTGQLLAILELQPQKQVKTKRIFNTF
ncbi:MAG: tRNA pseudouridine(55) synthase TruB [Bdellovibrionales bacterium]|nr:tRNA pseudouridine(55) synthase TruB [Bdellovibrionales bacterium]